MCSLVLSRNNSYVQNSDHPLRREEIKTAPKPAFSFAATMANLAKQKEKPQVAVVAEARSETAEEKAKRVRKERRRGLRVSFKNDNELVQIREFVHDPEEELNYDGSQGRDIGNSKGEGRILKMHKDLDLMDEEDEYEPPEDIEMTPIWITPTGQCCNSLPPASAFIDMCVVTDFSEVPQDELEKNYISRGGLLVPDSSERKIQEQRESSTLMVVYATTADIPSTPREPPEEMEIERREEEMFGEPDDMTKVRSPTQTCITS